MTPDMPSSDAETQATMITTELELETLDGAGPGEGVDEQTGPRPLLEVVKHTLTYGSGYVTMAVASFVLVPIYTRHLTPAGYGLLGLMLLLYGLMTQIYDFGVTNAVGRFFFDTPPDQRETALYQLRATALAFMVAFGGAMTLVLWVLAPQWSELLTQSSHHADLVRIVGVTLYGEALASVPLTMIRMQARSRLYVTIAIARLVVTLGLSLLLVVGLHWGVRGALAANAASAFTVVIVLGPDYRKAFRARPSWSLQRAMWKFGLPFFPVILSGWFIEASDRYLLGIYKGHAEVGYYVLGYKVAQIMQIALAAFSMGWAPLRYQIHERPDSRTVYRQITSYYVLASALLTVAIGVFAREIVAVMAPAGYASAAEIVPLIAANYALNGLWLMMVTGMGIAKRTVPMAWIVTFAAVVNIGVNVVAIPIWGMRAAAVTTVLAEGILVAGGWYYSQRVYPIAYDWRRIWLVIAIGTAVVRPSLPLTPGSGLIGIGTAATAWLGQVLLLARGHIFQCVKTGVHFVFAHNQRVTGAQLVGQLHGALQFGFHQFHGSVQCCGNRAP